jgi:anti-sigma factor ChrR (cupin superfamily)
MTASTNLVMLLALATSSAAGHAQDAAANAPAASAVPASLRGTWIGEESNSKQGRDWVAVIVHDDGDVDWYNDLKEGQLVGHREFPLDQDRAVVLTRADAVR